MPPLEPPIIRIKPIPKPEAMPPISTVVSRSFLIISSDGIGINDEKQRHRDRADHRLDKKQFSHRFIGHKKQWDIHEIIDNARNIVPAEIDMQIPRQYGAYDLAYTHQAVAVHAGRDDEQVYGQGKDQSAEDGGQCPAQFLYIEKFF